jgi:hypothetical protein
LASRFAWMVFAIGTASCTGFAPMPLPSDPTPEAYVARAADKPTLVAAGQYALDGRRLTCGATPTVLDPRLNDYAAAYPKFIIVRPALMARPTTPVKLWIYYHECGHIVRGPDTDAADCYGVERGVHEGWLTAAGLDQICAFIRPGHADATHRAGPRRCELMRACYKTATGSL